MTEPENEFLVPKEHLPVGITLVTGEELSGSLFVQPTWRSPSLEFDATFLLNLPDAYFPLLLPDGKMRLVAKGQLVLMRGAATAAEESIPGDPAPVTIRCSNGTEVRGNLIVARIQSNTRVLDFLNRTPDEFILLHEGSGTVLVNRRHVVLVTDESNAAA